MAEGRLDIIEAAILNGQLVKTETDDPRGPRHTIHGAAADGVTRVGIVGRFAGIDRYLLITVYEVT